MTVYFLFPNIFLSTPSLLAGDPLQNTSLLHILTYFRKDLQEEPEGGVPPVHDMEPHEIISYLSISS